MSNRKPGKSPQDFDPHLREIFLIAGFIGSGFTTCIGAYEIFNHNWLVALAIGGFFQGLMYMIGRYLVKSSDRRHRRTLMLCAAWGALAAFSVYASALAMFQLQAESLKRDHARSLCHRSVERDGKGFGRLQDARHDRDQLGEASQESRNHK